MLVGVTLTGADDDTDIDDLLDLSKDFPFVEWGILLSMSRVGTPRYPTSRWGHEAVDRFEAHGIANLSGHLCDKWARDLLAGATGCLDELHTDELHTPAFRRIQINGFDPKDPVHVENVIRLVADYDAQVILQTRSKDDLPRSLVLAAEFKHLHVLYDPSGGRGAVQDAGSWPESFLGVYMGFAGGIGPDNVGDVLDDIGDRPEPFWIDMESALRTDDRFDIDKCRKVLEICEPRVRV
jgi:hypothetical protein